MKGRPPVPIAVHKLSGTFRKDRHGDAMQIEASIPKPPRGLDKRARMVWRYYAPLLAACGVLTAADREALACFCVAAARRSQAEEELAKHGPIVKSPSGYPIQNPWLAIVNKATEQMLKWGQELGLSPSSRCRIKVSPPAQTPGDKARFFQPSKAS